LNPQFWAEDGKVWYGDAYNNGIAYSLLTPEAGYYQTASRVVAILALVAPLAYGPLIFNLAAIGVKVLIVNFLVSTRLAVLIPSVSWRCLIAFVYLALPHSFETHANLTNVQWHLAFLCFLILVSTNGKTIAWRAFDIAAVLLSALSGPFCVLLTPIAAVKYLLDRKRPTLILTVVFALGTIIQLSALLTTERPSAQPLGADFGLGMKIIAGHLFIASILGERGLGFAIRYSLLNDVTATMINLAGFGLLIYAFIKSRAELRLLMVFSLMIVGAAMASPAITNEVPQWTQMWLPGGGVRYWLIPIFCFFVVLLYLAKNADHSLVRYTAILTLALSLVGIAGDWKYPRFTDLDFQGHAARFENARPGDEVAIPINPNWEMRLRKK